ncbi:MULTISPECIES: prepilin-type N-terminal cleavage/methylation domain-containing protein [Acinetobacter]|uniref:prepilin-type N-terminal cleavage/methylation domain-containing protein n=1 Tax=Acinetobacter TaxID=469 RepID=UPI0015D1866C|nr:MULTISPECIES: prepilin-type N-terminal cleavage/methylation domain-containing protein [Acinetobacter]QOW52623.1 prepilin-type N-terminal cleavage/methylation domain-containing protein [Acinetobacter indicus]
MSSTIKKQQGMSLIEIMVALTISLVIILAILRAYVSLGYVSAETTRGASIDANIMKGLIVADRILQGVGYNMTAPTDSYGNSSDKLIQAYDTGGTATALNTDAAAIVWKLSSGNCQALKSTGKSLIYYLGTGGAGYSCTTLALPTSPTTTPSQTLISTAPDMPSTVNSGVGNISLRVTKLTGSDICTPFGVTNTTATASGGKYYVEVKANIYATSTSSTLSALSNSTCLFNVTT